MRVGFDDRIDVEPAGGDEDDRSAIQAQRQGRQGRDLRRVVRDGGLAPAHTRTALKAALTPEIVKPRMARAPHNSSDVIDALASCWAVFGGRTVKRLASIVDGLVPGCIPYGSW